MMIVVASLLAIKEVAFENGYSGSFFLMVDYSTYTFNESFKRLTFLFPRKIVLISHTVPMSLYIAIEALKLFQANKISQDPIMNHAEDANP